MYSYIHTQTYVCEGEKEHPKLKGICETHCKINKEGRIEQIKQDKNDMQFRKINLDDIYTDKLETMTIKINLKKRELNVLLMYNPCNNIKPKELEYYI